MSFDEVSVIACNVNGSWLAAQPKIDDGEASVSTSSQEEQVSIYAITNSIISEDSCILNCYIDNNTRATSSLDATTDQSQLHQFSTSLPII